MVAPCCYCGLPPQKAAQYVGIIDIVLGILNLSIMAVHLRESFEYPNVSVSNNENGYDFDSTRSAGYRFQPDYGVDSRRMSYRTFPALDRFPLGLNIAIAVCYAIQLVMGIILYIAAVNKIRSIVIIWMIITALTALFTGVFIRLYELIVVNEFARRLKQEEEMTYFSGQPSQATYPSQPQAPFNYNYNYNVSDATYPNPTSQTFGPYVISGYNQNQTLAAPVIPIQPPNQFNYIGGGIQLQSHQSTPYGQSPQAHQWQVPLENHSSSVAPSGLQPPPKYDEAVARGLGQDNGWEQNSRFVNPQFPVNSSSYPGVQSNQEKPNYF